MGGLDGFGGLGGGGGGREVRLAIMRSSGLIEREASSGGGGRELRLNVDARSSGGGGGRVSGAHSVNSGGGGGSGRESTASSSLVVFKEDPADEMEAARPCEARRRSVLTSSESDRRMLCRMDEPRVSPTSSPSTSLTRRRVVDVSGSLGLLDGLRLMVP